MTVISDPPPATGLYVHFPFCIHKCGYCDFNSWGETARAPQVKWLEAFARQAEFWGERMRERSIAVDTVFFGGGTPSLMENDLLVGTGELIRKHFVLTPNFEWTFEGNPETISPEKISALKQAGANRLSIGVQSFRDAHLERLERRARRQDNLRALETLRQHWSGRWSLDLMFGLPAQSMQEWREDLDTALNFNPDHISAYQLTLTTERSKNWAQASSDELLEMFNVTERRLSDAGLPKYETSNFAKPGHESRHNLRYWRLQSFVGLGPGASGLLPNALAAHPSGRFGAYQKNPDRFETWLAGAGSSSAETAWQTPRTASNHLFEMLMMGLRLTAGFEARRLGRAQGAFEQIAIEPQIADLLQKKNQMWFVTPRGARELDTLLQELFLRLEKSAPVKLALDGIDPTF